MTSSAKGGADPSHYRKFFASTLERAVATTDANTKSFQSDNVTFERIWVQGTVVSDTHGGVWLLDDGTGIVEVHDRIGASQDLKPGSYVLALGKFGFNKAGAPGMALHKVVDLTEQPNREPLWYLEILESRLVKATT